MAFYGVLLAFCGAPFWRSVEFFWRPITFFRCSEALHGVLSTLCVTLLAIFWLSVAFFWRSMAIFWLSVAFDGVLVAFYGVQRRPSGVLVVFLRRSMAFRSELSVLFCSKCCKGRPESIGLISTFLHEIDHGCSYCFSTHV